MKKIFSFAIVAAAAMIFAACSGTTNNQTEGQDSTATEEAAAEEVVAEPTEVARYSANYKVMVPAGWDWTDTVSELVMNNDDVALKFREGTKIDACKTNGGCTAENKVDEFTVGDITWEAYKTTRDEYQLLYIAQFPKEVVLVWSTSDDPANPDARKVVESVAPVE